MEGNRISSARISSARISSSNVWRNIATETVFSRSSARRGQDEEDDEEALKWAALEKLPTYLRIRRGILKNEEDGGESREIDITTDFGFLEKRNLLERLVRIADEDNENFLLKLKHRIDRVGLEMPMIEVRFEHLNVEAEAHVGGRGLPTIFNFCVNLLEFSGTVTYNGHKMDEFVPQRTSAYISQYDLHIGEMTILGLEICADTLVGDEMVRGISGGQKKRVTTAEMLVGPARALFMDEISTGLDSSTTFQIVNSLKQTIHILDGTALISLLQPAPETYDLFDDIVLLSDGYIVYLGPRDNVTSRKDQEQYWVQRDEPYSFITSKEFAEAFQSFDIGRKQGDELATPFDKSKGHPDALTTDKFGVSKKELLKVCISRETVEDGGAYMGALFFGLVIVVFNGLSEMGMTIQKLPVFYKQRDLLFFPAWTYALPSWILKIPIAFLEMASGLFRLTGALGRNMIIANTVGSFVIISLLVLGGFIISRVNVMKWWIWGYWISPLMYLQNALTVNEFLGHSWSRVPLNSTESLGVQVLKSRGLLPHAYMYWAGVGSLVSYMLLFNLLYIVALKYLHPFGKPQAIVPKEDSEERSNSHGATSTVELLTSGGNARVGNFNDGRNKEDKGRRGMVLPFLPLSITFDEIKYSVDMPQEMKAQGIPEDRLELLKGVTGAFRPGVLTALMGVSGAGKTTLMDVLAGRKTGGYIEGTIKISGDALVGLPGVNGLSTEQRKRLTIAVELVANPSIIFMDEPTSGLDARAAAIVMRTVRNTVDTGRTVVCTIHQPSIDIFDAFDELLLLKRGGEEIFVGPIGRHACNLIKYFEAIEGVPKIKDGYNPATWMLEITSAAQEDTLGELSSPVPGSNDVYFPSKYSQSFFTQCLACLKKQHWSYWRNPPYNSVRFLFTTFIALMFGSIFWDLGAKRESRQDVLNSMGSMYAAVLFIGFQNCVGVQPITLVYGIVVYGMIGFEWTAVKFFWYIFYMYFTLLYFTLYGMMSVAISPNHNIAAIISTFFFGVWNLFSGFIVPRPMIPIWWRWYYWACPVAWTLYGMIASQFGDITQTFKGSDESVEQFLLNYFGFRHDFVGVVAIVLAGICVLFGFIFAFSIKL
ncbi:Pleiotropic drug resistance protein 1 [Linum grandiflorum]